MKASHYILRHVLVLIFLLKLAIGPPNFLRYVLTGIPEALLFENMLLAVHRRV